MTFYLLHVGDTGVRAFHECQRELLPALLRELGGEMTASQVENVETWLTWADYGDSIRLVNHSYVVLLPPGATCQDARYGPPTVMRRVLGSQPRCPSRHAGTTRAALPGYDEVLGGDRLKPDRRAMSADDDEPLHPRYLPSRDAIAAYTASDCRRVLRETFGRDLTGIAPPLSDVAAWRALVSQHRAEARRVYRAARQRGDT